MTAEVPIGLVVVHVRLTLQVLEPAAMTHDGDVGVSVPDIFPRHTLPFHVDPDPQLALATLVARSMALLYRKKLRPPYGTLGEPDPLLPVKTVVFATG